MMTETDGVKTRHQLARVFVGSSIVTSFAESYGASRAAYDKSDPVTGAPQFAVAGRPRPPRFKRRAFGFADRNHLFRVRFGQLAPGDAPAALADLGQIFADFVLDCGHYGPQACIISRL